MDQDPTPDSGGTMTPTSACLAATRATREPSGDTRRAEMFGTVEWSSLWATTSVGVPGVPPVSGTRKTCVDLSAAVSTVQTALPSGSKDGVVIDVAAGSATAVHGFAAALPVEDRTSVAPEASCRTPAIVVVDCAPAPAATAMRPTWLSCSSTVVGVGRWVSVGWPFTDVRGAVPGMLTTVSCLVT